MSKRVYIIHGWGGGPKQDWLDWLRKVLEKKGFEVYVPEMPNTWSPKISEWNQKLREVVEQPDSNTYFVGHSIGCQAIMRYLEKLPEKTKIGGAIFVAGWFNLTDETWDETYTKEIANEWLNTPISFFNIKQHCDQFVVVNSDNDPYVPLSDADIFKEKLGARVMMKKKMGHISEGDGTKELPIILDKLLKMAK